MTNRAIISLIIACGHGLLGRLKGFKSGVYVFETSRIISYMS